MRELIVFSKWKAFQPFFLIKLKYIPEDWNLNSEQILLKKKKDYIALIKVHLIWAWLLSKYAPWDDFLLERSMKISVLIFVNLTDDGEGVACGSGSNDTSSSVVLDHSLKMNGCWNYHFGLWCCKWIHLTLLVWIGPKRIAYKTYNLREKIMLFLLRLKRRMSEKFGFEKNILCLLALNSSKNGAFTTLLGNLTVKNFLIITNINLLFLSLKPFPFILSNTCPCKKSLFTFLIDPFRYCKAAIKTLP